MCARTRNITALAGVLALAAAARADVTYLTQARSISAETSANNNVQTIVAPGFGPFVENLMLATTFQTPGGLPAPNLAEVGIDCQLDPNAVIVVGSLFGAGGLSVVQGVPVLQFGEAGASVETLFRLDTATSFTMLASPRPSNRPGDRFKIKLKDQTNNIVLFLLEETMPPQLVNFSGTLAPGDYELEYQVELTVDGPESLRDFSFNLSLGNCYANCDGSTVPPVLNVNDFVCFMSRFAAGHPYANCDGSTATPALNINDFICYQQRFAAGCS